MLSEEKIIRMTKLAAFEKREGKKNLNIVNYYRNDYIGFQVLKSIIASFAASRATGSSALTCNV